MIKQAILFTPPFPSRFGGMPIGLLELGTMLQQNGIETNIIDLTTRCSGKIWPSQKWQPYVARMLNNIVDPSSCFIGISATSPSLLEGLELATFIRKILPNCLIALGGPHMPYDKRILNNQQARSIDWAYHGQILDFKSFIAALVGDINPSNVPNLSFRSNGTVIMNNEKPYEESPDEMIMLDINMFSERVFYTYGIIPPEDFHAAQLSTMHGCTFHCRFCTVVAKDYPHIIHSLPAIRRLLEHYAMNGVNFLFFDDPTFTINYKHFDTLLNILEKDFEFKWACQTRIDLVNPRLLDRMKKAGCEYIFYGVETGAKEIKKYLKKDIENETIKNNIISTLENDISPGLSMIFGVPNEKESDLLQTYDLIREIDASVPNSCSISISLSPCFYAVYPGSQAANDLIANKIDLNYLTPYSRENIWLEFDDGYGAFHYPQFGPIYAEQIDRQLDDIVEKCRIVKRI